MKKSIKIPKFKNEEQERTFWAKIHLHEHLDANDFESVSFPNLKPSSRPVSLRIPAHLLVRIKEQANEINVPYQSLMKRYLAQGVLRKA